MGHHEAVTTVSASFMWLTALVSSPLLGVLLLAFIPANKGQWLRRVAILSSLLPLVLAGIVYAKADLNAGALQLTESFTWVDQVLTSDLALKLDYTMAIDGISLPLIFLSALVAAMAMFASVHIKKRWKSFFIFMLVLEVGMLGVFMAQSLTTFFIFFELTLIPMYFLIGIWGGMHRERAANQFLIYNGLGSAVLLFVFIWLISTAGVQLSEVSADGYIHRYVTDSFSVIMANLSDLTTIGLSTGQAWTMFILLVIAFGVKLPIFPFHTWMLRVHAEAPPAVVMIHSGILLKMGAYGLLRIGISFFPALAAESATWLAVLGVINLLYGAFSAFVQDELRLVLAYSSISHMGIILLGFAANNQIGYAGAVFQMVSHGLISALFFLLVGTIFERTGTTVLSELGGMSKSIPFISAMLLIAGLASLGLPGLSGFVGEFMAFVGIFENHMILGSIAVVGIVLTAAYVLRGVMNITFGQAVNLKREINDAQFIEATPMIILVAFIVLIGVYPSVLSGPLDQSIQQWAHWLLNTQAGG